MAQTSSTTVMEFDMGETTRQFYLALENKPSLKKNNIISKINDLALVLLITACISSVFIPLS